MALSKQDREEIAELIRLTVNGKIDRMSEKMDAHIDEVGPYLKAMSGLGILYKGLILLSALFVAIDQIFNWGIIKGIIIGFFSK